MHLAKLTHSRRITLALSLGSFLVFCNLYLLQPMLPILAKHYQVSETQVNWLFAATTLGLSIALLPMAMLSESIGRRGVMLTGLMAIPLCSAMMLISEQFWLLALARALLGVALAAFAAIAVAYMAEELPPSAFHQAIGTYIAANSLGGIIGRISGGMLTEWFDPHHAILVMLVVTLFGASGVVYLLPKQRNFTAQKLSIHHQHRAIITHLRSRKLWLAMLIGGVNFALFVNLYSVMGFRLSAPPYSLPVGVTSLIFLCYFGGTVSSQTTAWWMKKRTAIQGMLIGSGLSLIGLLITTIAAPAAMILGLLLISVGAFFTHTLAYGWVGQHAQHAKASATALYLVHYYIGGSLGGFVLLFCWQHWGWSGVVTSALGLYAVLFLLIQRLASHHRRDSHNSNHSALIPTEQRQ